MSANKIKIDFYNTFSLKQETIDNIRQLLSEVFPVSIQLWKKLYSKKYISMCVVFYDKQKIIAHGSIIKRIIEHRGKKYCVGGIGNIFVIPTYRHLGIGSKVLAALNDMLFKNKFDIGVLFCHPKLHDYYAGENWIKKKKGKVFYNENGNQKSEETTYILPISGSEKNIESWMNDDIFIGDGSW